MKIRQTLTIAALILIAIVTGWLAKPGKPPERRDEQARHDPDYYMENATLTTMNPLGRRHQVLRAETLVHYPDDDSTDLGKPHLSVHNPGKPPWEIISETGWVSSDAEEVHLLGPVEIQRTGTETLRPITILTTDLRVRPDDSYAETDEAVSIQSVPNTLEGVGMHAYFREPMRLQLLSEVRGKYEVQ